MSASSKRFNRNKLTHDIQMRLFNVICEKITNYIIGLYQNTNDNGYSYNEYLSENIYNYTDIVLISTKLIKFYTYSYYDDTYTFDQRQSTTTQIFEIICEINNENKICLSYITYNNHAIKDICLSEELQNIIIEILHNYMIDIIQKLK
jgi:hypothetical protein